ncbi:hypothetical protein Verru16b_03210 [Lacunisphaera limnophila]|uniref:RNA polymerase sigma factor 70 region 4 type 2 domain-containing protein n=2 Tax=Lacunisphaera limnophila TaxID=1838286 RepID=A0A1D8AZ32_9BACT|nr:hypothetical protein Verru16b_03210 [Lacunisphaera limnophila]
MLESNDWPKLLADHLPRMPENTRKMMQMLHEQGLKIDKIASAFGLTESKVEAFLSAAHLDIYADFMRLPKTSK